MVMDANSLAAGNGKEEKSMVREEREGRPEWVEHLGKALEAFIRDLRGVLPEETYEHLRASQRESLLAVRSLIDRQIERLEKRPEKVARKVEVQ